MPHDAAQVAATPLGGPLTANQFRCPDCATPAPVFAATAVTCEACDATFPVLDGKPLLVPHDATLFNALAHGATTRVGRPPGLVGTLRSLVPSPGINPVRSTFLEKLLRSVEERPNPVVLVLGAANQREELAPYLRSRPQVEVVYTDVDPGSLIDLYADAQRLPFEDRTFDAVLATGILNSTMYPQAAVAEMHRVLKDGGTLYSEVPFVQQVVFGPYDFQRFTLSGHRHLFRDFERLDSGMVAGPATVLYWTLENLVLCFAFGRSARNLVKAVMRIGLSWIKYLDHLLRLSPAAVDGASNTYLFARKREDFKYSDDDIIAGYTGSQ